MIRVVRRALLVVGPWTSRRVLVTAVCALLLAAMEMTAFGLLYVLIGLLAADGEPEPPSSGLLRAVLGDPTSEQVVARVATATVSLLLLKSGAAVALARWNAGVQAETEARLANRLYEQYLSQDYLVHIGRNSAELVRNLTASVVTVCSTVIGSFTALLSDSTVLLGVFVTLVVVDAPVALCIAAYLGLVVAGYLVVISPVIHDASVVDNRLYAGTLQTMQEGFSGIKAVQVFDVADSFTARYQEQRAQLAAVRRTTVFVQRLPPYYLEACVVVGIALGGYFLVQLRTEREAFALLGLLVAAALRVLPSVNRVLQSMNAIRSAGPSVENLAAESSPPPAPPSAAGPVPALAGTLQVDGVRFAYPGTEVPALDGVDITVAAGSAVGIVGPSGSGKTTLVDLLLGLLRPTSGRVLVDGVALVEANTPAWRRQVGYVPQETYLMDASVLDNVLFGRDLGDDRAYVAEAVWTALDKAQLRDVVLALPAGLATPVGERGARLSGGQRQRLGIARALLLNPRVLILDEATSALDGATEAAVAETVTKLHGQVTMLIIAHRLSTVRRCDRILLVDRGRVTADGTFHGLYDSEPGFRELVDRADLLRTAAGDLT